MADNHPRSKDSGRDRRAVLYARCASDRDGWGPVTAQLRTCRRLATDLHLSTDGVFVDRGVSGLQLDRPGLVQMLAYIEKHPVDYVICADVPRLSRSSRQFNQLARRLEAFGVLLVIFEVAVERYPDLAGRVGGPRP